ncbi:MAG: hypothetical protein WC467_03210 [Patescibacteria group bacterium]
MKNFFKKSYLISILIIVISAIVLPVLVFSWGGAWLDSYSIPSGQTKSDVISSYGDNCKIDNHSGKNLFLPNKTSQEWLSVRKFATSTNGVDIWCCGDGAQGIFGGGVCNVADNNENCTNCPSDCGACTTCTSFVYSGWSECYLGTQTRIVVSSTPATCTGGSPVLSQACNCGTVSGCDTGYTCYSGSTFYNTNNCSGSYVYYSMVCHPSGRVTYTCVQTSAASSQTYIPTGGCTRTVACATPPGNGAGLGCQTGFTCLHSQVSNSSPTCQNLEASPVVCIPDAYVHLGCNMLSSTSSYQHELATGCTYMP